jgi:hypothetical protein
MKPSEKRLYKKIIDKLERTPVPLSINKGTIDRSTSKGANSKDRRHSGRITICYDDGEYPIQETFWDDWSSHRDGMRDKSKMHKNLYPAMFWMDENEYWDMRKRKEKIKKREDIKKARKNKEWN